ncbi:PfkB family carbohydrate kinase [Microbacterium sp.]|uniref:1-phosphofructokinase family hexose kinase n=1 Tax=Microbacterium sp. TaxID=51671 RepID=UPI00333E7256
MTPNPALDLTWHVDRIVPGGTHRADAGVARAGGKGLNVARVAHAAGAEVVAVATVGGPGGEEFAAELAASGVPAELVPVAAPTRRSIALVDEHLGDTTIVNERGVAPAAADWDALASAVSRRLAAEGEGERVLVISGSLPPGAPDELLPSLIALGREAGAVVIVDTSGPALLAAADAGAEVLKPNAAELAEATGVSDPEAGARELIRRGASLVLLSRGAEGMLALPAPAPSVSGTGSPASASGSASGLGLEGAGVLAARLPEALAGNPTGAGDAAVAAVAVLLASGIGDPETLLRRAVAWSAAAVLMPLAGDIHPSWPEIERSVILTRKER